MQFGGTPMVHSSTGASASNTLISTSTSASLDVSQNNSSAYIHNKANGDFGNQAASMFAPHSNIVTQHNLLQGNNTNGQMSNGVSSANGGNHYVNNNHQQQQQSQVQQQQQMNNGNHTNGHASNGNSAQLIYPALHLQPLNDTFAPKQISLSPPGPQNKVKIGRHTNQKTVPQPSNGYFDSKVLSRMHAEVWSQDGKVFIKDVKSSNGTFINRSRLSPEGQESDTFELHTNDIVEFGIDIDGEDNKTTLHHKVACRAFLVMTAEEALGLRHDFAALYRGGIAGSTLINPSVGPGAEGGLRRSKAGSSGSNGYGGTTNGGAMMSFDHILHKLQAELQKSRDTAGELGNLNTAMHDIGETLGGGLPPMQRPPYQHMVPSINGEREVQNQGLNHAETTKSASEALVKVLEEQVQETQRALNTHVERLAGLEARLEEHDGVKMDVNLMQSQVEEARNELAEALRLRSLASRGGVVKSGRGLDHNGVYGDQSGEDDFDDGASMASVDTVVPGKGRTNLGNGPIGVDEIELAEVTQRFPHPEEDMMDDAEALQRLKNHIGPRAPPDGVSVPFGKEEEIDDVVNRRNEELSKRLEAIESQLERALELGKSLAGQHTEATEAVKRLEERVKSLESEQESRVKLEQSSASIGDSGGVAALKVAGAVGATGSILTILETKWGKWRGAFESDFEVEKANFREEREEVKRVVKMWDGLNSDIEDALETDTNEEAKNILQDEVSHSKADVPNSGKQLSSKKRRKRRAAAAAAAAAAASSSTSSVGLSASSPTLRSSQDSTTARINRELRSLLYTDTFNQLVREEDFNTDSPLGSIDDREGTPTQSDVGGKSKEGGLLDRQRREQLNLTSESRRKPPGTGNSGLKHGLDGPTTLPMLSVAGVVVFGMTAWALANGKGINLGSASGG